MTKSALFTHCWTLFIRMSISTFHAFYCSFLIRRFFTVAFLFLFPDKTLLCRKFTSDGVNIWIFTRIHRFYLLLRQFICPVYVHTFFKCQIVAFIIEFFPYFGGFNSKNNMVSYHFIFHDMIISAILCKVISNLSQIVQMVRLYLVLFAWKYIWSRFCWIEVYSNFQFFHSDLLVVFFLHLSVSK